MLKNKLIKADAVLEAEKKKSSKTTTKVDDLRRQLSCLDECNKKLVEESGKNEAKL